MLGLTAALLASTAQAGSNPAYDTQLDTLVGQDYRAAVSMLGMPSQRSLREGGGEIWTFQSRSDDRNGAGTASDDVDGSASGSFAYESDNATVVPATSQSSGTPPSGGASSGSGSTRAPVGGSTNTGNGITATRSRGAEVCTTRIALDPDGTIAGYNYQGTCRAER
ncbi:hypothetical protein [Maricaulis sp.]|uniref:hypothetical protein n=1 Tax=Maricaulis sp. TaxID=1486257 RepID=UPI001B0F63ED|nr:hypothetical protein [Maricaulis sp.]MBO6795659.1 hypothetical protein [Maricaulis sp.]